MRIAWLVTGDMAIRSYAIAHGADALTDNTARLDSGDLSDAEMHAMLQQLEIMKRQKRSVSRLL
jgi:hypothetical protein